ncbi:hypothetical protein CBL_02540 [Carabus blaptoides fortunei]
MTSLLTFRELVIIPVADSVFNSNVHFKHKLTSCFTNTSYHPPNSALLPSIRDTMQLTTVVNVADTSANSLVCGHSVCQTLSTMCFRCGTNAPQTTERNLWNCLLV